MFSPITFFYLQVNDLVIAKIPVSFTYNTEG